jgi:hypothetical protein
MSKLERFSAALTGVALFATPATAAWYDKSGAAVDSSHVVHCILAPDTGQFAGGPYNNPPCEPATRGSGTRAAWHDRNGAVIASSRVAHCIRAQDAGQFAGGPFNNPPCEPATWRSGAGYRHSRASYIPLTAGGGSNNRGGLVGGSDPGTYKP